MNNEVEKDQSDIKQLVARLGVDGFDLDRTLIALRARLDAHEVATQAHLYPELIRARSELTGMVHARQQEFRDIDTQLRNVEIAHGTGMTDEVSQLSEVVDRQFGYENEMMSMLAEQVPSERFEAVGEEFESRRDAELKSMASSREAGGEPSS